MSSSRLDLHIPGGWTGWLELARTQSGTYAGFAMLSLDGVPYCALVITQQLSWEAAVARANVRATHFVRQWSREHMH